VTGHAVFSWIGKLAGWFLVGNKGELVIFDFNKSDNSAVNNGVKPDSVRFIYCGLEFLDVTVYATRIILRGWLQ